MRTPIEYLKNAADFLERHAGNELVGYDDASHEAIDIIEAATELVAQAGSIALANQGDRWGDTLQRARWANTIEPKTRPLVAHARSMFRQCCDQVRRRIDVRCVCSFIAWCPEHGETHVGTHD